MAFSSVQGLGGERGGGAFKTTGTPWIPFSLPRPAEAALFFLLLCSLSLRPGFWTRANDGGALFVLPCAFGSVSRLRVWIEKLTPTKLSDD